MSFVDWFKAGPQAAEKVLDAGIKGIDAMVYTEEEKAGARQKLMDWWLKVQQQLGEETTVRSITRRVIAFAAFGAYLLLVLVAAATYPWWPDYAKFLVDLAEGKFGWIVLTVVGFYFGPPMLQRMNKQ